MRHADGVDQPGARSSEGAGAHGLEPVVHAGSAGVTEALVAEVDRALTAHELIKVKVSSGRPRGPRRDRRRDPRPHRRGGGAPRRQGPDSPAPASGGM